MEVFPGQEEEKSHSKALREGEKKGGENPSFFI
jgi:hypothetical protein